MEVIQSIIYESCSEHFPKKYNDNIARHCIYDLTGNVDINNISQEELTKFVNEWIFYNLDDYFCYSSEEIDRFCYQN